MDIIFGSSGFIGRNLAKYIFDKYGKNNLVRISRSKGEVFKSKKNFYQIDLRYKRKLLNLSLKNINRVFICSGISKTYIKKKSEGNKQIINNRNILKNIIIFCKKNNVKKIIFLSSSTVYSKINKYPLSENQKIKPKTFLGKSKKINENQLLKLSRTSKIKVLILRIFTVYGKGMRTDQFITQIIKKIKKNKKVTLWNPNTFRNLIFIKDLNNIIDLLSKKSSKKFDIINVASNKSFQIKYIFKILSGVLKKKRELSFSSNSNNFDHFVNISKLKNKIKKFKFTKLEDGLRIIQ